MLSSALCADWVAEELGISVLGPENPTISDRDWGIGSRSEGVDPNSRIGLETNP